MKIKRKDERIYRATVFDGRGIGRVRIEDGYGRTIAYARHDVVGVHTESEAIAAAKSEGEEFFREAL